MYMSDSDDEYGPSVDAKGKHKQPKKQPPPSNDTSEDDESVMGFSDEEDDENDIDDFDDEEHDDDEDDQYDDELDNDEFGNVHQIRAKKQEMGSDIEDGDEAEISHARWGKKVTAYYGEDYKDNDGEGITESNRLLAEEEEEEGLQTQRRILDQLDEAAILDFDDFPELKKSGSMQLLDEAEAAATADDQQPELRIANLNSLSSEEKLAYLQRDAPELFVLLDDYRRLMSECEEKLMPALHKIRKNRGMLRKARKDDLYHFVYVKQQLQMRYCLNICFYLVMKTGGKSIRQHQIRPTLALYKKMCREVQSYQENLGFHDTDQLLAQLNTNCGQNKLECKTIIPKDRTIKSVENKKRVSSKPDNATNAKRIKFADHGSLDSDSDLIDDDEKANLIDVKSGSKSKDKKFKNKSELLKKAEEKLRQMEKDEEDGNSDEHQDAKEVLFVHKRDDVHKRRVNRMIEKNKGLTPYRKKQHRNPRLHYKSKFERAEKKRKSQVKDVVKELSKYSGEYHGIKAAIVRSVKLKQ